MHTTMAFLPILLLLLPFSSAIATHSSYIPRTTVQQIVASVPPAADQNSQPFITSPSGTYAVYLRRSVDSSGGPGGDTCYIQIQQVHGGKSVWESECTPVGGADTCDLAFSPMGLELFAGGHSLWDTGVDGDPGTLSLDDGGDMHIVDKEGVTVWNASGEPWAVQECGVAASPAMSPEIGGDVSPPSIDQLPPPSPVSAMPGSPPELPLTPPPATPAAPESTDITFGDQPPTMPPIDMSPASPDHPLYSAPPVPTAYGQQPPLMLPVVTPPSSPDQPLESPPVAPPTGGDETMQPPPSPSSDTSLGTPFPPVLAPHGGPAGGLPLPPSPIGMLHGSSHQPFGASPPRPVAVAPSAHGGGLPFGQGQQQGQGVFGQQQQQLFNGANEPLVDSSGGWSITEYCRMTIGLALIGLMAFVFGF